ncbi:MAG: hypothetical protein QOK13_770 [Gaiellaceae bacterium]|nr:hypothetical protein [Gaiellaceae bacterium]
MYGFDVATDVPLARLRPTSGQRGLLTLALANLEELSGGELVHEWFGPGVEFRMHRRGDRLHCSCSVTGSFLVDAAAGSIQAQPRADRGTDEMWEHRMVGTALPLLVAERGDLVLHAAAVETAAGAVLFAGPSGRGKSTLALSAPAIGLRLLAEDGVDVDGDGLVWPGPRGVRLRRDVVDALAPGTPSHAAWKSGRKATHFIPGAASVDKPVRLAAVVVLGERTRNAVVAEALDPTAAVPALLPSLIYGGSDRLHEAFALACRLVERVPVFRASVPDDLAAAPNALRTLVDLASGSEPGDGSAQMARDEPPRRRVVAADGSL